MKMTKHITNDIEVYSAHRINIRGELYAAPATGKNGHSDVIVYVETDGDPIYVGWITAGDNGRAEDIDAHLRINAALAELGEAEILENEGEDAGWAMIVEAYNAAIEA